MDKNRGQTGANMAENALKISAEYSKTRIHIGCPTFFCEMALVVSCFSIDKELLYLGLKWTKIGGNLGQIWLEMP